MMSNVIGGDEPWIAEFERGKADCRAMIAEGREVDTLNVAAAVSDAIRNYRKGWNYAARQHARSIRNERDASS